MKFLKISRVIWKLLTPVIQNLYFSSAGSFVVFPHLAASKCFYRNEGNFQYFEVTIWSGLVLVVLQWETSIEPWRVASTFVYFTEKLTFYINTSTVMPHPCNTASCNSTLKDLDCISCTYRPCLKFTLSITTSQRCNFHFQPSPDTRESHLYIHSTFNPSWIERSTSDHMRSHYRLDHFVLVFLQIER